MQAGLRSIAFANRHKNTKTGSEEVEPECGTCRVLAIMRRVARQCISPHVRPCPLCGAGCGNWKIFSCLPRDRRRRRHAWSATEKPSISGRRCKRLAPAHREGKHFANGAAASLCVFVDSHFRRCTADKSNDKNRPQLHAASCIDTSWIADHFAGLYTAMAYTRNQNKVRVVAVTWTEEFDDLVTREWFQLQLLT